MPREELVSKVMHVLGHQPGLREEIVILRKLPLHLHQVSAQMILFAHHIYARELADFLIGFHFGKEIWCNCKVVPADIPHRAKFPTTLLGPTIGIFNDLYILEPCNLSRRLFYHIVFGTVHIHYDSFVVPSIIEEFLKVVILAGMLRGAFPLLRPLIAVLIVHPIVIILLPIVIIIAGVVNLELGQVNDRLPLAIDLDAILVEVALCLRDGIIPGVVLVVRKFALVEVLQIFRDLKRLGKLLFFLIWVKS